MTFPTVSASRVDAEPSQTALIFLPLPGEMTTEPVISGLQTQAVPIAHRLSPEGEEEPRHLMVAGVNPDGLPDECAISWGDAVAPEPLPEEMPVVEAHVFESVKTGIIMREYGEVRITGPNGSIGIRLGLDTDEGIHWWEWVTLQKLWSGPVCSSWRVGGYAAVHCERDAELIIREFGYRSPDVHKHNWVYGDLHLLLFANGVVRLHARHINNRFFDRGRDLEQSMPIIGFGSSTADVAGPADWEAFDTTELAVGPATIDLREAQCLCNEEQPARLRQDNDVLVYQPYGGVEIYGNRKPPPGDGSVGLIVGAGERRVPQGVARTVRMTLSLSDAPPHIGRYRIPSWYLGNCGHLWPGRYLPARSAAGNLPEFGSTWLQENMLRNCFEDGSIARGKRYTADGRVGESGWEGETPFALMRAYYLLGRKDLLDDALRNAYNVADVATDHSEVAVRMHGQDLHARSLPMQRILGLVSGYLETGDPYLLETAQAVMDNAYWWDRTNWPRRSVGRDAAYVRGLVALATVCEPQHYLRRAGEALRRFASIQRPDGAFADQGGTVGSHAAVNEILKPWMNSIMAEALLDYLEHREDDAIAFAALGIADWLRTAAIEDEDGVSWAYKYRHGENETAPYNPDITFPQGKGGIRYNILRPLLAAALSTGDATYTDLCLRHLDAVEDRSSPGMDQSANKCIEMGSWFDARLWHAAWDDDELVLQPAPFPAGRELSAVIPTPQGDVQIHAVQDGNVLTLTLPEALDFPVCVRVKEATRILASGATELSIELKPAAG